MATINILLPICYNYCIKEVVYYQTVDKRLLKVERGLFGENRRLSKELYELKFQNGLRIYYTEIDNIVVLLFTGGNKSKRLQQKEKIMKKSEKTLLQSFPKHQDLLKQRLKEDDEYAQIWLDNLLEDYSENKDVNDLICNLKPLIEAKYTVCEFAKLIDINRITLYKIYSRKMVPSIEMLNKIFTGLGYNLKLSAQKS